MMCASAVKNYNVNFSAFPELSQIQSTIADVIHQKNTNKNMPIRKDLTVLMAQRMISLLLTQKIDSNALTQNILMQMLALASP